MTAQLKKLVGRFVKSLDMLDVAIIAGIGVLCYLVFFNHLGDYSLRMWDESRNAVNALEMIKRNNYIVSYFNGAPDFWNTKPPLFIWIVTFFFRVFGPTELALRLPSAIAASLTVLLIYLVPRFMFKERFVGLLASLILVSSMGFSDIHIGRSGDFDAVLTLWVFLACVMTFEYIHSHKNTVLYGAALMWVFAMLTKGIAGLFMAPAVLLYIIFSGQFVFILKNKKVWIVGLVSIGIITAYYFGRNLVNPGYLAAVWKEELLGRFGIAMGATQHEFAYYWNWMKDFRFQKWIYFLPFTIISYFLVKTKEYKRFILFAFISVWGYFLLISSSASKQLWYDAQLYPFASILVSALFIAIFKKLPLIIKIVPIFILCFYLQRYIRTNIAYIYRPDLERSVTCLKYGYAFRDNPGKFDKHVVVDPNEGFCMPLHFYLLREGLTYKPVQAIQPGDRVLTCDSSVTSTVESKFKVTRTFESNDCWGLRINEELLQ